MMRYFSLPNSDRRGALKQLRPYAKYLDVLLERLLGGRLLLPSFTSVTFLILLPLHRIQILY